MSAAAAVDLALALELPVDCQVGDTISLEAAGRRFDLAVIRRRWVADQASWILEITLDFPLRGAR